jgi:hypothetical protein
MRIGPRKMEDNIKGITDFDQNIYRIFSYQRFEELIKKNELVLVNPSKWDDPFENFFLNTEVDCGNNEIASLDSIANSWYGQCWTTNSDTDAMWRIYSPNKDGIRVSTTVRKLFSSIFNSTNPQAGLKYFIGLVKYKKQQEIISFLKNITFMDISMGGQNDNFAELLCIKRTEFSHESEVRLLVNDEGNNGVNGCYKVPFSANKVLEEVCIDPRATPAEFNKIQNKVTGLGVTLPIIQSALYKLNLPRIKLGG